MKRIYGILGVFFLLIGFVACSRDEVDNPYAKESTIRVDSCSVLFQAAPSTGHVKVVAPHGITKVESEHPWCTATVSGDVVTVKVEENAGALGRSSVLMIYSGDDFTKVTVQQTGIIFAMEGGNAMAFNDAKRSFSLALKHNVDVKLTSMADWITCSLKDGEVAIDLTKNETGHMRQGYIKYQAGSTIVDSIKITQCDFDKDIVGMYHLVFYKDANKTQKGAVNVKITKGHMEFPGLFTEKLNVDFDSETATLSIASCQYLGEMQSFYLYTYYESKKYWTVSNSKAVSLAPFSYSEKEGTTAPLTGIINGEEMQAMVIGAFKKKTTPPKSANLAGSALDLYYPYLVKITE